MKRRERQQESDGVPVELSAFRDADWPQPRQLARMKAWMDARTEWQERTGRELPDAPDLPDAEFDPELDL